MQKNQHHTTLERLNPSSNTIDRTTYHSAISSERPHTLWLDRLHEIELLGWRCDPAKQGCIWGGSKISRAGEGQISDAIIPPPPVPPGCQTEDKDSIPLLPPPKVDFLYGRSFPSTEVCRRAAPGDSGCTSLEASRSPRPSKPIGDGVVFRCWGETTYSGRCEFVLASRTCRIPHSRRIISVPRG